MLKLDLSMLEGVVSQEQIQAMANLSAQDGADTELELLCQAIVSKDEFDFFLRLALGATTFIEESKRLHIKLPACYKRFERIRDKLQRSIGKYYKHE